MAEPDGSKLNPFIKDPDADLDYAIDWSDWLEPISDTIESSTWAEADPVTVPPLTTHSPTANTTHATIWLGGGSPGTRYALRNRIVTVGDRINDRTIYVKIREQ